MRLLFVFSQVNLTRHFDGVLLSLADRGHHIHVVSPRIEHIPLTGEIARHPRISDGICPDGRTDQWREAVNTLRSIADYVRYLDPGFAGATKLRDRAFRTMAKALSAEAKTHLKSRCPACKTRIRDDDLGRMLAGAGAEWTAFLGRLLAAIESRVPSDPAYEAFLREQKPDALLVTPVVNLKQSQADWFKAARTVGVPAGFPVFSWDNLTTKGLVHGAPDRVFVWNEVQRHGRAAPRAARRPDRGDRRAEIRRLLRDDAARAA